MSLSAGSDGAALVADVEAYVAEWRNLLVRGVRSGSPVAALVARGAALQERARRSNFGGLAHHLSRLDGISMAPGGVNAEAMVAPLRDITEIAAQTRHAVANAPSAPPAEAQGSGSLMPPRMLTHLPTGASAARSEAVAPVPFVEPTLASARGHHQPKAPSLAPPPLALPSDPPAMPPRYSPSPAPLLEAQLTGPMAMPARPSDAPLAPPPLSPVLAPPGALPPLAPPGGGMAPPPPIFGGPGDKAEPLKLGLASRNAPAPGAPLPPPVLGLGLPPTGHPAQLSGVGEPGGPSANAPPLSIRGGGPPKLMVRTMFGLRAFGKTKQEGAPAAEAARPGSLLGLRSLHQEPGAPGPAPAPAAMPRMLSNSLPPLAGAPRAAPEDDMKAPASFIGDLIKRSGGRDTGTSKARDRERDTGPRQIRASARQTGGQKARPNRRQANEGASLVWAYVAFGGVALAAIALVVFLVLRRSHPPAEDPTARADSSARAPAPTISGGDPVIDPQAKTVRTSEPGAGLPRERLLNDDERLKSLIVSMHGKGKESPELRALMDDQAAQAARMLGSDKCEGSAAMCAQWNQARDLLTGDVKPIQRRTKDPTNRLPGRWMAGLRLPDIPIEDDERVQRVFEYYTDNQVGRERFQSMLFRCGAYRDLIKATLVRYEVPMALLAMVFTESGCEPTAKSPVGAQGLWQFMPDTGRAYHLRIVEDVLDERQSALKSTEAAVHYLADMKQKMPSWDLVFASYNLGPFGVLARLRKAGDDVTFWDLADADYLPDETANYVPTIQAFALILENLQKLKFAGTQMRAPEVTADLEVASGTRLGLVARAASTSFQTVKRLNLDVLGDVVPAVSAQRFMMQVPKDNVWQARDTLTELISKHDDADVCVPVTFDWGKQRFTTEMAEECRKRLSASQPTPAAQP